MGIWKDKANPQKKSILCSIDCQVLTARLVWWIKVAKEYVMILGIGCKKKDSGESVFLAIVPTPTRFCVWSYMVYIFFPGALSCFSLIKLVTFQSIVHNFPLDMALVVAWRDQQVFLLKGNKLIKEIWVDGKTNDCHQKFNLDECEQQPPSSNRNYKVIATGRELLPYPSWNVSACVWDAPLELSSVLLLS